jgi:hypothetical protein
LHDEYLENLVRKDGFAEPPAQAARPGAAHIGNVLAVRPDQAEED